MSAAGHPPAVRVEGVSKAFRLPHEETHTLKERALHPFRRSSVDRLEALRDVTFEIHAGEYFGIVGRNGSGKSTLLKCLAGIYGVDTGRIALGGRLAPFIELGVGFNPDLTAHDNVIINAVMLGLSVSDARARYDEIIEFAELEQFVDLKLKNYSSGMQVRLAFAVMVQVDADILLIDEVLAVGDAAFQQKCHDTLHRMREDGRTIVLVTHDMEAVKRVCDRAMVLERGDVVSIDAPERTAQIYNEINFRREVSSAELLVADEDAASIIHAAWFEDDHGQPTGLLQQGAACAFCAEVEFREPTEDPVFGFALADARHRKVMAGTTAGAEPSGRFGPGERAKVVIRFNNVLAAGRYTATATVASAGSGAKLIATRQDAASALVTGSHGDGAAVVVDQDVSILRAAPAPDVALDTSS